MRKNRIKVKFLQIQRRKELGEKGSPCLEGLTERQLFGKLLMYALWSGNNLAIYSYNWRKVFF